MKIMAECAIMECLVTFIKNGRRKYCSPECAKIAKREKSVGYHVIEHERRKEKQAYLKSIPVRELLDHMRGLLD